MGFANCLQWRQKAMYVPYGAKCKPLPGRLPRPYHHLPHKAPALAPPCVERPWARKVVRSARGYSSLLLLIAVMLSLVMCIGAALRPEAFSSGLLTHGALSSTLFVQRRLPASVLHPEPSPRCKHIAELHLASRPAYTHLLLLLERCSRAGCTTMHMLQLQCKVLQLVFNTAAGYTKPKPYSTRGLLCRPRQAHQGAPEPPRPWLHASQVVGRAHAS